MKLCIAVLSFVLFIMSSFGHGDWTMHYNDVARVLNGFGTPDGNNAKAASSRVGFGGYSQLADDTVKTTDKANAGFFDAFQQVSGKMDAMPKDIEIVFGLPKGSLSNPKVHRMLCHGWPLDRDPPQHILAMLSEKYGIPADKFLNYWHQYQKETFALFMEYTKLPLEKAKAFAGIIWDIHLIADLGPDNGEVKWVMNLEDIVDDLCEKLQILLGERANTLCKKIRDFVKACREKGIATKYIASMLIDFLSEQKLGTRIFKEYKEQMAGLWDADVAVNVNEANSTKKVKQKVAEIDSKKKARERQRTEGKRKKGVKKQMTKSELANDLKKNCRECRIAKGDAPKGSKISKGYLLPVRSSSGASGYALIVHSKALRAGVSEGVLAFVISEGVAVVAYKAGCITEEEFCEATVENLISSTAVGAAVAVAVVLGSAPGGPIVLAIGIGGYFLCDMVFDMTKQSRFTLDDVLGSIPDDLLGTESCLSIDGAESYLDAKGEEGCFDLNGVESSFDSKGVNSSFDF